MYWARFEGPCYTFDGFGATEKAALAALKKGWLMHVAQTGATIPVKEVLEDSYTVRIEAGMCLRDRDIDLNGK